MSEIEKVCVKNGWTFKVDGDIVILSKDVKNRFTDREYLTLDHFRSKYVEGVTSWWE